MAGLSSHNRTIVDQHNQQAKEYARLTGSLSQGDRSAALRARIGAGSDDEVLDVACGPGRLSLELAPHVRSVTGLDLTEGMLEQARSARASTRCDNVEFVQGDGAAMPFSDDSFSVVISSAAFHHFEVPRQVLAEMTRVCRPGGRIVVSDVTPAPEKAAEYDAMELRRDPSHGHAHPVDELVALGSTLGLAEPEVYTSLTGPMPYAAVLETSFPEAYAREELLAMMREDAAGGTDRLGFKAALGANGDVLVSYPMSQVVWLKG